MSTLELSGLQKSFDGHSVLQPLTLQIDDGEFIVCVGPSGCGKSTLLRLIAGLEAADAGRILIDGHDVTALPPVNRSVAMVFQNYALYPHLTVEENIGFGLMIAGVPKAERHARVLDAARKLQLEPYLSRRPKALSGGQRQRVAIGRAIVKHPKLFLFDEPLSNLDAELRQQMRLELARLHQELRATMIYVTHDQVEAMTLADRIVVLRQGQIEQVGTPRQLYEDPDNAFVAGFIGSPQVNFLRGTLATAGESSMAHTLQVRVPTLRHEPFAAKASRARTLSDVNVTVGIRPEFFEPADADAADFRSIVRLIEHLGSVSYLHVETTGGARLTIERRGGGKECVGDVMAWRVRPNALMFFDASGSRL
jgi:ABC-type sugar transport system ATPase subunit